MCCRSHSLLTKQKSPKHPNGSAARLKADVSRPLHTHVYLRPLPSAMWALQV